MSDLIKRLALVGVTVLVLLTGKPVLARQLTVASDGSGDYKTIQSAIDSIPAGNRERVVINLKSGTYREQVRLNNSFVTLRGEDRKSTRIVAEVNTSACEVHPDESKEEHCAVVIGDGTDLVFENLTIENTFKAPGGKGAALSVVNESTRIIVHNADILGYGGDTLVLSARRDRMGDGGEYYINDVKVSGTYHIIVPRGAAYVVNSSFWCIGRRAEELPVCGRHFASDRQVSDSKFRHRWPGTIRPRIVLSRCGMVFHRRHLLRQSAAYRRDPSRTRQELRHEVGRRTNLFRRQQRTRLSVAQRQFVGVAGEVCSCNHCRMGLSAMESGTNGRSAGGAAIAEGA